VPAGQLVAGSPTTGYLELGVFGSQEYGIWEMTPGTMTDVEADEIFVVLFGAATVELVDDGSTLTLGPGSVARLTAGMRTLWTVTETLRKVYVMPVGSVGSVGSAGSAAPMTPAGSAGE
jgi:uncharacterized cupin superfamily protein